MSDRSIAKAVAEHPKLAGMLFTMMLVLSSAGTAVAGSGAGNTISGP